MGSAARVVIGCAFALQVSCSSSSEVVRTTRAAPMDAAPDSAMPPDAPPSDVVAAFSLEGAYTEDTFLGKTFVPRTRAALANAIPDYARAMQIADRFEEYCLDVRA